MPSALISDLAHTITGGSLRSSQCRIPSLQRMHNRIEEAFNPIVSNRHAKILSHSNAIVLIYFFPDWALPKEKNNSCEVLKR
jgi:hypothetical protein